MASKCEYCGKAPGFGNSVARLGKGALKRRIKGKSAAPVEPEHPEPARQRGRRYHAPGARLRVVHQGRQGRAAGRRPLTHARPRVP